MTIEKITTEPDVYEPFLPSQSVRVGSLLLMSGQSGCTDSGQIEDGGFHAQGEQAFLNLDRALTAGGSSFGNVVKVTTFLTNVSSFNEVAELRRKYFGTPYPADRLVEVSGLYAPEAMIETEAIAVLAEGAS